MVEVTVRSLSYAASVISKGAGIYTVDNTPANRMIQGCPTRCPGCLREHPMTKARPGREMACPSAGCGTRLRLNPFTLKIQAQA
jgi:hypothetical protein